MLLIWLMFGVVTAVVASNKGRNGCGWFLLGLILGPFGFILALVVSKDVEAADAEAIRGGNAKKCPFCAEMIKSEAIICKHCGKEIPEDEASPDSEPESVWQAFQRGLNKGGSSKDE